MKILSVFIPPEISAYLRHLHPEVKQKIKKALREIETNPFIGKSLKEPLEGLLSLRVTHYRIVYEVSRKVGQIKILDIAERKVVYERMTLRQKSPRN